MISENRKDEGLHNSFSCAFCFSKIRFGLQTNVFK